MFDAWRKRLLLLFIAVEAIPFLVFGARPAVTEGQLWNEVDETKPLVLAFHSTECPIASRYVPVLEKAFHSERYGLNSQFYLVFSNQDEDEHGVAEYLKEMKITIPSVLDAEASLANRFGAEVTPEIIVLVAVENEWLPVYQGKIDDRYEELGQFRPKAEFDYLEAALDAVLTGDEPEIMNTKAVGCYIYNDRLSSSDALR